MATDVEWQIATRYLRARRADGGVSAISLISLIGIALGVFAMIATFAVREGFRAEYINTILGNEGHASVYPIAPIDTENGLVYGIEDYDAVSERIVETDGVRAVIPVVTGQVLASNGDLQEPAQVWGIAPEDFITMTSVVDNPQSFGNAESYGGDAIAIGQPLANRLGLAVGDRVIFTTINKLQTAFGTLPRQYAYDVAFIYSSGNDYLDGIRVYVPLDRAQSYFNLEGVASQIDYRVDDPSVIENYTTVVERNVGGNNVVRTWKQKNARVLSGLKTEDNLMFIITGILVLVSTFTIVAGQIMLVKNKTGDIAILRTMGFSRGSITRIFFFAGMILGLIGTIVGVVLGVLFSINFTPIFNFVNVLIGGGAENTWALQNVPELQARLTWTNVLRSAGFAIFLSVAITYLPARSAAKLDPAEALRHG